MGSSVVLVGHGRRRRQQTGRDEAGVSSDEDVLVRRYRCRECGAVVVVMPRGMRPRLRYRVVSIVHGLALWAGGLASAAVRARISSTTSVAHNASRYWSSLARWLRLSAQWVGGPLQGSSRAERVEDLLQRLAARATGAGHTGQLTRDALRAAEQLGGHGAYAVGERVSTN